MNSTFVYPIGLFQQGVLAATVIAPQRLLTRQTSAAARSAHPMSRRN